MIDPDRIHPQVLLIHGFDCRAQRRTFTPVEDLWQRIAYGLWVCRTGRMTTRIDGTGYSVGPGGCLLTEPGTTVTLLPNSSGNRLVFDLVFAPRQRTAPAAGASRGWLTAAGKRPQPGWQEVLGYAPPCVVPAARCRETRLLVDDLHRIYSLPGCVLMVNARFFAWLADFLAATDPALVPAYDFAARAEALFVLHLPDRYRLADYARLLGVSTRTFTSRYRQQRNRTPGEMLDHLRLHNALKALRSPSLPSLSHIAYTCGFLDVSAFIRWFRRQTGTPPMVWRRDHLAGTTPFSLSSCQYDTRRTAEQGAEERKER